MLAILDFDAAIIIREINCVSHQGAWYVSVTEANGSVIFRSFR